MLGDWQHVQHRFVQKAQRAFRAAQQAVEVELPLVVAQVGQVVAGQAAVERREFGCNQVALLVDDVGGGGVYAAQDAFLLAFS